MNDMKERGVFYKLSLQQIDRWSIVEMIRKQSVAEHTYNVHVLAMDLWDWLFQVPHNSFEREACSRWALEHDLDEVFTGDLPSPIKAILNRIHPGITVALKEEVMRKVPSAQSMLRSIDKGSVPYQIVAVVDIVEALLYLRRYAIDREVMLPVKHYLEGKLADASGLLGAQPRVEKSRLIHWLTEVFDPNAVET